MKQIKKQGLNNKEIVQLVNLIKVANVEQGIKLVEKFRNCWLIEGKLEGSRLISEVICRTGEGSTQS